MKERPILFSAPMVRAILDGTKTQTRRVVKPQPEHPRAVRCPYGQSGDRLWVRETWQGPILSEDQLEQFHEDGPEKFKKPAYCVYSASDTLDAINEDGVALVWKPSIHMPRWASRITLEVTGVRVERLRGISHADAIAEGVAEVEGAPLRNERLTVPQHIYAHLWEQINGPRSWDANPWVWVIEFRRLA